MSLHRSFSFQSHDDDPVYHPLNHHGSPPPPPPPHRYPSRRSPPPALPRRMDSSDSSSSSISTVSSLTAPSAQPSNARRPVPAAAAVAPGAMPSLAIPDPPHGPHGLRDGGVTPQGGYREDERFWGRELGYSRSLSSSTTAAVGDNSAPHSAHSNDHPMVAASAPNPFVPLLTGTPQPPPHSGGTSPDRILNDPVAGHYTDNPYKRYSTTWDPQMAGAVDGNSGDILSDDDDIQAQHGHHGGVMAALGGMVGRKPAPAVGVTPGLRGGEYSPPDKVEKSEWLRSQVRHSKRNKWLIGALAALIVAGAIAGIVAGIVVSRKNNGSSSSSGSGLSADEDVQKNGDLDKDSDEIKALMNNADLKQVFHGIDYTPLNAEYPDCLTNPPTQNNITRDMAVMSQLTTKVRLYGTDCNQTEMVLHAIDKLDIKMTVWLGVWLDSNKTTNARQLSQLYDILDDKDHTKLFEGVAVGNEVLYRKDLTETELFSIIADVKANVTSRKLDLPVATSDLGSNWNSNMASKVDVVMANVHPFFAGVKVDDAAGWTYSFFEDNDVAVTSALTDKPRVMISEVGWPSGGGKDEGSVAGVDELNTFMDTFVCQINKNGTEYFWFEAFDEPWKVRYNEPKEGKEWEDKWGVLDVNRKLKSGVKIPDCKT